MLEGMAVGTKLNSLELSSGKCDVPVIRYFQTAAFSGGFDLDAIEHERLSRIKRFIIKSQRMQKDHIAPASYYNNNWQSKQA